MLDSCPSQYCSSRWNPRVLPDGEILVLDSQRTQWIRSAVPVGLVEGQHFPVENVFGPAVTNNMMQVEPENETPVGEPNNGRAQQGWPGQVERSVDQFVEVVAGKFLGLVTPAQIELVDVEICCRKNHLLGFAVDEHKRRAEHLMPLDQRPNAWFNAAISKASSKTNIQSHHWQASN